MMGPKKPLIIRTLSARQKVSLQKRMSRVHTGIFSGGIKQNKENLNSGNLVSRYRTEPVASGIQESSLT
jgi:hypothetical protein